MNNQRELWIEFARTRGACAAGHDRLRRSAAVRYHWLDQGARPLRSVHRHQIRDIRDSIIDELRSQDVIPRSTRQRMREITAAQETLLRAMGRDPTIPEIAESTGMTERRVVEVINLTSMIATSLDRPMEVGTNGESISLVEVVEDPRSPNPVTSIERRELEGDVADAIDELPERERLLLALYYQEDLTMNRDSGRAEYFRVAGVPVALPRRTQAAHHAGRGLARQGVGLTWSGGAPQSDAMRRTHRNGPRDRSEAAPQ